MATLQQAVPGQPDPIAATHAPRTPWLRFFLLYVPLSLLAFGLALQAAAYALRNVQPFRSTLDTIAAASETVPGNARWLIFSDSLTQHVLSDYSLGPPGVVDNLTTHAGAGMPSMYLLLRRYLATHEPPKDIMLAMSPGPYTNIPDQKYGTVWLVETFVKPQEQAWLSQYYPAAKAHGWRPAAFDIKAQVLDPMTGLVALHRNRLIEGPLQPSPAIPVEAPIPQSKASLESDRQREAIRLSLGTTRPVLADICRLAKENGITVHMIRPPLPAAVRAAYVARGDFTVLDTQVRDLMTKECGAFTLADLSAAVQPPNFDEDGTHIEGKGWEGRYALALKDYIDQH